MSEIEERLVPPPVKPRSSVARILDHWYVACTSEELGDETPLGRTILGVPMVIFRAEDGRPAALLDRCAHRNVPLSLGRVVRGRIECGYHGWQYDGGGACREIPGLCDGAEAKGRGVDAFAVVEKQGHVFVYPSAGATPAREPLHLPLADEPRYTTVRYHVTVRGSLHATVENALDVPHTAFLHAGLFRGAGERHDIEATVRRWSDRVEAEYVGEPRPGGLIGRIVSPKGGVVSHFDRFILPSIAQVEYRLGDASHLVVTSLCTPIRDFETALYAVVSLRLPVPGRVVRPILQPIALKIFEQDAKILAAQTDAIRRFGGEHFVSTELDLLGAPILRLLREAERGELPELAEPEVVRTIKMRV